MRAAYILLLLGLNNTEGQHKEDGTYYRNDFGRHAMQAGSDLKHARTAPHPVFCLHTALFIPPAISPLPPAAAAARHACTSGQLGLQGLRQKIIEMTTYFRLSSVRVKIANNSSRSPRRVFDSSSRLSQPVFAHDLDERYPEVSDGSGGYDFNTHTHTHLLQNSIQKCVEIDTEISVTDL